MYKALYRKWRPETFGDVVGQHGITTALKNQIAHEKIGHAYIFTGIRGTGKTTCAKIFAKAVNCIEKQDAEPCGECPICQGIDKGSVMDVVEIDAASNNGVDNIRDLRDETAYTPSECTYKVYIIDEVHMLSTAAFNALLKIMEEPPAHVIFILATTEIHKVPATVLSRCQRYDFTRITPEDIANRLLYVAKQESIVLQQDAAELIARLADGAMRDALSILDTCLSVTEEITIEVVRNMAGVTNRDYLFEISEAVSQKDASKALTLVAQLREKSIDIKRLCDELILHYRNLLLAGIQTGENILLGVSKEEEQRYQIANVSQGQSIAAIRALCDALDKMSKGTDARIQLELALFSLCEDVAQPIAPVAAAMPVPVAQPFVSERPPEKQKQPILPTPVPQKAPVQETPSQTDGIFEAWPQVVQRMKEKDQLLYVNMQHTKAHFKGRYVLIEGSDLFLEFMRQNDYSKQLIKQVIQEITGARYNIGPYKKQKKKIEKTQTAEETLSALEQQGVTVIYKNED